MADWTRPLLSDLKVDVLDMLKLRDVDAITLAEAPTSPPVGAKRWNTSLNKFEAWNGTAWVTMVVSIAGGGTGATDINGFLDNFNLGSMSLQDSDNVMITSGAIHGLGGGPNPQSVGLQVLTNAYLQGLIFAGSAPVALTNTSGYILEVAIADGTILARVSANEIISGSWTFNGAVTINNNLIVSPSITIQSTVAELWFVETDAPTDSKRIRFTQTNGAFYLQYYNDATTLGSTVLAFNRTGITPVNTDAYGNWKFLGELLTIGSGSANATLFFDATGNKVVDFGANGRITSAGTGLYSDHGSFSWRSANAASLYAFLDSSELYVLGAIRPAKISYPAGGNAIFMSGSSALHYADSWQLVNKAATASLITINSLGSLTMHQFGSELIVGGSAGNTIRIHHVSPNAYIDAVPNGSVLYFRTFNAVNMAWLDGNGDFSPTRSLFLTSGTPDMPAIRFHSASTSGAYFNTGNPTVEYGANFNLNIRATLRTWHNQAKVDFLCATVVVQEWTPGQTRLAGDFYITVHHGYLCGEAAKGWYGVYALNHFTSSDVRMKDVHGPITNVLDAIDSVSPIIASMKLHLRPKELDARRSWGHKVPSFSAQEIAEKIDSKYGTRLAHHDEETDSWVLDYDRMSPLMWQAIRELYTRVKALEP